MDAKTVRRVKVAGALLVAWFFVLVVLPSISHRHDIEHNTGLAHDAHPEGHDAEADVATRRALRGSAGLTAAPPPKALSPRDVAAAGGKPGRRSSPRPAAPTTTNADAAGEEAAAAGSSNDQQQAQPQAEDGDTAAAGVAKKRAALKQPLLPAAAVELLRTASMPDIMGNTTLRDRCPWDEKESAPNVVFMKEFSRIFRDAFPFEKGGAPDGSGLHWMLDEGGLIGSSRAGSMANADDDFDFLMLLPNQHAPCRPDSLTCTEAEFEAYIHKFLMVFWNEGMCINKFHPDRKQFKSRRRLMYTFQVNRRPDVPPDQCFVQREPFAHMHLGMLTPEGKLKTNIWAAGTTHPMDELDLSLLLPVQRCRAGPVDAPCPRNVTGFLTVRNRGEYRNSGDGNCLLVRKKWGAARKRSAVQRTKQLAACGYNTMVDLVPAFEQSDYRTC